MIKYNYIEVGQRLYPKDNPLDMVISALPPEFSEAFDGEKCWIAGGFIRRWWFNIKQDSDIDLFFDSQETYNRVCEGLAKIATEPVKISQFNHMYLIKITDTWTIKVQAIRHLFYKSIHDLFDSFDFTICQFAYSNGAIIISELGLIDGQRKRLVPHKITYGASSLRRIIKYSQQGYYMCNGSVMTFLQAVGASPDMIRDDVISVD